MHSLVFYEPGHFHAALTLRRRNPRVRDEVHLYARPSADRDKFLALVEAFNARAEAPTAWKVALREDDDADALLERLIRERAGDAVVLAGRNDRKLAWIARLQSAGFAVLADKPWLTHPDALPHLRQVTEPDARPLAMDIMTERHDVIARLRQRVVAQSGLLGDLVSDDPEGPAIELGSTHHLLKLVNGVPLQRPPWYYDVRVQGDGLVDIQSHMTDQVQWMLADERPFDADRDLEGVAARRWPTPVPLALYRDSVGQDVDGFPPELAGAVRGGELQLACNGEIAYRLRGVSVRQRAEWGQREPPGGGDLHHTAVRGERAVLRVRQGAETGYRAELHLCPRPRSDIGADLGAGLEDALASWQREFPGVGLAPSDLGFEITVPDALRSGHEAHFGMVLEEFLDHLDHDRTGGPWPAALPARIRMRYRLLAEAQALVGTGAGGGG